MANKIAEAAADVVAVMIEKTGAFSDAMIMEGAKKHDAFCTPDEIERGRKVIAAVVQFRKSVLEALPPEIAEYMAAAQKLSALNG